MAGELADVERRHEVWSLRAKVLQKSPHLLARGLGLHMAEELDLARTIAYRLDPGGSGSDSAAGSGTGPSDGDACEGADIGLYPRLLAAVAARPYESASSTGTRSLRPSRSPTSSGTSSRTCPPG